MLDLQYSYITRVASYLAISASYNIAGFWATFFTTTVISRMHEIGVGWVVGRVGSRRWVTPSIRTQTTVLCLH